MLRAGWLPAADSRCILHAAPVRVLSQRSSRWFPTPLPRRSSSQTRSRTHSWVAVASVCTQLTSPERANAAETETSKQCELIALCAAAGHYYFCALLGGNGFRCKLACHHHGLPFSSDMDFTYPAGRLHPSKATLHPLVLEYHQGMFHLTRNI